MKIFVFIVLSFLFIPNIVAQKDINFGIFAGTSYYLGDLNPSRHFNRPRPAFGIIHRINLNPRYSIRTNLYYARLSGSDEDFDHITTPERVNNPASFTASLIDVTAHFEINFLSYKPYDGSRDYTTYISFGLGGAMLLSSNTENSNKAPSQAFYTFPVSIGLKTNITPKLSAGCEWSFRKTSNDRIDGTISNIKRSFLHNNDWYSFLGIFITYKFINFAVDCPAYN